MITARLKTLYFSITGDPDQISSERYFITVATFASSVFLYGLCGVHLLMGLKVAPVIYAGSSALVMLGLYFLVRFGTCLTIPKVLFTALCIIMLDFTWYAKFMSNGPVLFFILIFGSLVIWVWQGKYLAAIITIFFINIIVLGVIDYHAPESLFMYPDPSKRTLDIYLSFFLYSVLLISLLYIVKNEFIRQKEKATKSDRIKSAFLANMSHEIRTPMNAIVGFSQLIGYASERENQQLYINIIQQSTDSLLRLINDIIDLSKIEAGDLVMKESDISIHQLFIELKNYYSNELLKKEKYDVVLDFTLPKEITVIQSDPVRLKQILSNLLDNAIKFTSRGSILFSCEKKKSELIFTVSDTGTGIPEEDQKTIFNRFTKFNYQGLNTEGSGIGLSIVEKLVELFNGRVWFESTPGSGSVFHFAIPLKRATSKAGKSKLLFHSELSPFAKTMKSVLIVEDDKSSYVLMKEFLKPLKLDIHHVTDGTDAIQFIKNHPDTGLVLMDIKLPFMDGYEASKAIKKINPNIPIIAQTAYAMPGDREKAIGSGCDEYITKPLELAKLQELVKSYLLN